MCSVVDAQSTNVGGEMEVGYDEEVVHITSTCYIRRKLFFEAKCVLPRKNRGWTSKSGILSMIWR